MTDESITPHPGDADPAEAHDAVAVEPAGAPEEHHAASGHHAESAESEETTEDGTDAAADDHVVAESESLAPATPAVPSDGDETPAEAVPVNKKKWYIVKVTSGREESIKAAIERRVKIEGLEQFFGQVFIPVERVVTIKKVKETKNGEKVTKEKKVTKQTKKFPGYVMAEVEFNDEILYLFRETSGVGDFVGAAPGKPPAPMADIDIRRMLGEPIGPDVGDPKKKKVVKLDFEKGDKVRIREGAFANMEGEVKEISDPKDTGETPKVTVVVPIFGRPVEVSLEYWQVDKV
ncbi:transcription termination/antitermination protein NusG [Fimbriiglobus ruber]|uniref:Transcription termination/antitermination protein NusG n=1 Tax=Fimbriiglobus ruber TaxID=1908690 RepID=A0A225D2W5_9BACT|nr:transcription termination/antitermination NusG family protein [Fimbriiglobus ruber]OWK35931.1 Transcription antitermination protein NusG [Fimbriiglobus ruber]